MIRRATLEREGLFDTTVSEAADTDMWVRLFSRYGVRCLPQTTCAYTIHEAAATTGMWHPGTVRANAEIFDRAVAQGVVPEPTIRRWQADLRRWRAGIRAPVPAHGCGDSCRWLRGNVVAGGRDRDGAWTV